MSARPDTWMPMYWGDYARDTGNLNNAGHGAYLMLIKHYWCTGSPLVDDDDELWRTACCDSKKEWLKLRKKIVRLFESESGCLRHKRIDRELANAVRLTEQRQAAGKASSVARNRQQTVNEKPTGVERPLNDRSILVDGSVDDPLQRNGRPSPSPSHVQKETSLRDVQKPRKTQVPADWQPNAEGVAYAKEHGLTPADLEAFRDHYRGKGKPMLKWDLVWKNWCRNAKKFGTVTKRAPDLLSSDLRISV